MPADFLTLAQGGLDSKKKKKNQCWLLYKHRAYVHFYGPRYIACQCAKSVLGQSPGTLLPPFFPNTMKGIGLHPGQDSQPGLPGHQSAPPGPQRDSGEALAGQHSWTQAAKQSLSSRACLGESREGNGACGKEQGGHGYIWVQGRSLPCCSLSHCCCSFDPLRWTETPWDPKRFGSCVTQLPPLGKDSLFPSHPLYFTGWCLWCPLAHRRVQKWIPPSRHGKKGGGGGGSPARIIHLQESIIRTRSQAKFISSTCYSPCQKKSVQKTQGKLNQLIETVFPLSFLIWFYVSL